MEYKTGDVIGAYRLLEQCGKGSFGQVFLAENLFSGQTVALKLLTETGKAMQKELDGLIRFRSCRHPNLLPILHIDKVDNHLYYTMPPADNLTPGERYSADTLAHRLSSQGPLPASEVMAMTVELLAGLKELHRHKLMHRDIKPDNILWLNRQAVLADVGLVRNHADTGVCGSPGFMPEDVLAGQRKATAADDLYALGKVIYCALTGLGVEEFPRLPGKFSDPVAKRLFRAVCMACSSQSSVRTADAFRRLLAPSGHAAGKRIWLWGWLAGGVFLAALLIAGWAMHANRKRPRVVLSWGSPPPVVSPALSATPPEPPKPPELPSKPEPSPYPAAPSIGTFQSADSKRLREAGYADIDADKELALLREKYLQLMPRYTSELQEKCSKRSSEMRAYLSYLDKSISDPLARAEAKREIDEMQSADILCRLSGEIFYYKHAYELFIRQRDISSSGLSSQHRRLDYSKYLLDFYDSHCQTPK